MRRVMSTLKSRAVVCCLSSMSLVVLWGCGGGGSSSSFPTGSVQLSVQAAGGGGGTVNSNPVGIDCGKTCTADFSSGTKVTLTATAAANSFFAGWSGACSGTGACQVTLTQNTSVMANFSSSPTLGVILSGTGKGIVTSNPAGINCGPTCSATFDPGTPVTLTATAATNSSFVGWGGACTGSNPTCTVTLSASQQVTATFNVMQSAPQLSVSLAGNGSGTVTSQPPGINCGSTCSASFANGTQVTLTATPAAGSSFAGWGGACAGTSSTCTLTLTANEKVTAIFNLIQASPVLTVILAGTGTGSVSSNPAGITCPPTCSASFSLGTQVTLSETPEANSYFAGWSVSSCGSSSTCVVTLNSSQQVTATFNASPVLSVTLAGTGSGSVSSSPPGISCPTTCNASFGYGTQVTLTETPATGSVFSGWSGACSGNSSTCTLTLTSSQQVTAAFNPPNITVLNHIIFMAQENRSFDHYFGEMRQYWADNGYPDQDFDGLPQFNPGGGQPPTNPGCNPNDPPPDGCVYDPNNPITSYHLITQCIENPSPSWNEAHVDYSYYYPEGQQGAALDGFVNTAGGDARVDGFYDVDGIRAMGYYEGGSPGVPGDLNYYYFMASNFATSDRWFHPVMTRTHPNREYLIAATSQGYVYPVGTDSHDKALLTAPTIFQELQAAGISWKIYVDPGTVCQGPPYNPSCLLSLSYVQFFQWGQTIPTQYPNNIGTIGFTGSDYDNDLANGTLPQVAQIEPATDAGYDEHPSVSDSEPNDIQRGANYVATQIINPLMASSSWQDSAFILTWDENGGLYDHVAPQATVSPDGIKPVDFLPGDICTTTSGPTCDFVYTGYRIPLIVVSPYTQKNYVSHTVADTTAILKFIETRFNLAPLTKRDAAQMDMTEFFDFSNPPWLTPPTPPAQNTDGACYLNKLP
jgi:phospholipase C